ncbi:MAG: ATP-dependent zinc protease [Deltaproteobacteria bacterium]|jgi:hypothetical protein|nr:ATP-dependent zinc protease [Deltaproteobacteria bacterium]
MKKKLNNYTKTLGSLILIISVLQIYVHNAISAEKQVAGWVENVILFPGNIKIKAKLDTGARNSSLNADQLEEFEREGATWVRFQLKNWRGQTASMEAKVVRITQIKQHGTQTAVRPVIRLGICLGNVYKEVEVNLEDREKFNYQLLIGRSYLRNSILVDASTSFKAKPNCLGVMPK